MSHKVITIFGSGTVKEGSEGWQRAHEAGFLLAQAGFTIANGGYGGVMEASASGAQEANGHTIGVTTDAFGDVKKNPFIEHEIRKERWRDRLHELMDLADGFLVLDGGSGTLAELMVCLEMSNKGLHRKPIAILGKRIRSLIQWVQRNLEFLTPKDLRFFSNCDEAVRYLSHSV